MAQKLIAGDKVIWKHEHRGGYGFLTRDKARVVKVNTKTVTIELENLRTGKMDRRNVKPENLELKDWQ